MARNGDAESGRSSARAADGGVGRASAVSLGGGLGLEGALQGAWAEERVANPGSRIYLFLLLDYSCRPL